MPYSFTGLKTMGKRYCFKSLITILESQYVLSFYRVEDNGKTLSCQVTHHPYWNHSMPYPFTKCSVLSIKFGPDIR